jgi:hypothetical protein
MRRDVDAVMEELIALRLALTRHVLAEQPDVHRLPSSASAMVVRGQQDLLRLIDQLIGARGREGQHALRAAVDLTRRLSLQARIEGRLLGAPPAASGDRDREVDR